jgi:hypothetical protein
LPELQSQKYENPHAMPAQPQLSVLPHVKVAFKHPGGGHSSMGSSEDCTGSGSTFATHPMAQKSTVRLKNFPIRFITSAPFSFACSHSHRMVRR